MAVFSLLSKVTLMELPGVGTSAKPWLASVPSTQALTNVVRSIITKEFASFTWKPATSGVPESEGALK